MDAYRILGLQPGADEDQVKAAYRALAQKYNPELYEAGPLRQDAEEKMDEINQAFDSIMAQLRGATTPQNTQQPDSAHQADGEQNTPKGDLAEIRRLLGQGQVDQALARLNAIPGGVHNAEWNFLMGSAYYYKGWLGEALRFFEEACRLAPSNREYAAALHNLKSSANGQMPGNPYATHPGGAQASAMNCSCCDMCTFMICMDACCGCGRGC